MHYPLPDKKTLMVIIIIVAFAIAIVAAAIMCADGRLEFEDSATAAIGVASYSKASKSSGSIVSRESLHSIEASGFRFELLGEDEMEWTCGRFFDDPGFVAEDADGNDISHLVTVDNALTLWRPGEYRLSYILDIPEGKSYRLTRTVELKAAELPGTVQTENTVYLTFDDGPCQYTGQVLDLLDKYDAKATFFVISGINPDFEMINEILARGHSIGIHSSTHEYGDIYASEEAFFTDLLAVQQRIYASTGQYASISRFPGGSATARAFTNAHVEGGFQVIEQGLANMGIRYYDWNIQTESPGNSPKESVRRFISGVPQFETPISLQHDTALFSVNALEDILKWCSENGYSFGVIDLTTPEVHSRA